MKKKELAINIIKYLENYIEKKIPEEGFLAGQSVAEAYFRINNIDIETRIKDLDIFTKKNRIYHLSSNLDEIGYKDIKLVKNNLNINVKNNDKYVKNKGKKEVKINSFEYEKIDLLYKINTGYKIAGTYNIDYLNIVTVENVKAKTELDFGKQILSSFDLNSIKIGICLKTKQIIISNEFLKFLKTRQVEIISYNRPIRTAFRFLEKQSYYKNVFFNNVYELNLLIPFFYKVLYNKRYSKLSGDSTIQEVFDSSSEKAKEIFKKIFKIKEYDFNSVKIINFKENLSSLHDIFEYIELNYNKLDISTINLNKSNYNKKIDLILESSKINQSIKKEIFINKKNIILRKANKHNNIVHEKIKNGFKKYPKNRSRSGIILSENIKCIRAIPNKRNFNFNIKNFFNILKEFKKKKILISEESLLNRNFIINIYNIKTMNKLKEYLNQINNYMALEIISSYLINHYSLKEILEIKINDLKKLFSHSVLIEKWETFYSKEKEYKRHKKYSIYKLIEFVNYVHKKDKIFIIGRLESNSMNFNVLNLNKNDLDLYIEKIEKIEKKECLNLNKYLPSIENYKINHIHDTLTLKNVGQEMKHCVGGYTNSMVKMDSLFFDIYNPQNKRITLELKVIQDENVKKYLKYSQARYFANIKLSKIDLKNIHLFISKLNKYYFEITEVIEFYEKRKIKKENVNKIQN